MIDQNEKAFVERLNKLTSGWVEYIEQYGLMHEVYSTFMDNFGDVEETQDDAFLTSVHNAMIEWDI